MAASGALVLVGDIVEIDTNGWPSVAIDIPANSNITAVFEAYDGAAWAAYPARSPVDNSLVNGVTPGQVGQWIATPDSAKTKFRVRCTVAGAAPSAEVQLGLPSVLQPSGARCTFAPYGTAGSNPLTFTTWAETMAFVASQSVPVDVYVDWTNSPSDTIVLPAGTFDMKGGALCGPGNGLSNYHILQVPNGCTLQNLNRIRGWIRLDIHNDTVGGKSLDWTTFEHGALNFASLYISDYAQITTSGAQPPIIVDGVAYYQLDVYFNSSGSFIQTGAITTPVVHVNGGQHLGLYFYADCYSNLNYNLFAAAADATSLLYLFIYGNASGLDTPSVTFSTFALNKININGLSYGMQLTTADRNGLANITKIPGTWYYDKTVLKPVWWNGANWTDATGTIV